MRPALGRQRRASVTALRWRLCALLSASGGSGCAALEPPPSTIVFVAPSSTSSGYVPVDLFGIEPSFMVLVPEHEARTLGLEARLHVAEFGEEKSGNTLLGRLFTRERAAGAVRAARVAFYFAWQDEGRPAECRVDLKPRDGDEIVETPGPLLPQPAKRALPKRELGEECTRARFRTVYRSDRTVMEYVPQYCPPQTLRYEFERLSNHLLPRVRELPRLANATLTEATCYLLAGRKLQPDRVEAVLFYDR